MSPFPVNPKVAIGTHVFLCGNSLGQIWDVVSTYNTCPSLHWNHAKFCVTSIKRRDYMKRNVIVMFVAVAVVAL